MRIRDAVTEAVYAARKLGGSAHDCCVFAHDVLVRAYNLDRPRDLALWRIYAEAGGRVPPERVWGPVDAAVAAMIGRRLPAGEVPSGGWALCQGWDRVEADGSVDATRARGHTWLWLPTTAGYGIVADSSATAGARVHGPETWRERTAGYHGGVAVAALYAAR